MVIVVKCRSMFLKFKSIIKVILLSVCCRSWKMEALAELHIGRAEWVWLDIHNHKYCVYICSDKIDVIYS